jgi:hypothetical protein
VTPLTLANGFIGSPGIIPNTFGVDPNYKVSYTHNWYVSVQQNSTAASRAPAWRRNSIRIPTRSGRRIPAVRASPGTLTSLPTAIRIMKRAA